MKNRIHHFMQHNMLVNWGNLKKCILLLSLTILEHFLWILWKVYIIYTPSVWKWVELDLIHSQLIVNIISVFVILLLMVPCFLLRKHTRAQQYLPYFVLTCFSLIFIRDAYLIGILSPATLCGYVCMSGVGILLFQRKFLYTSVVIATSVFIYLGVMTLNGTLPYAPLFSQYLKENTPPTNTFWVLSMLYFIVPLLLICIVLCEIMLIQWQNREKFIKTLSQTDPLTNLWNRRFFSEKICGLKKNNQQLAIIILDLDHFKAINDQYGHSIGDDTLKLVSQALINNIHGDDIVARYGGEEFIIALLDADQSKALDIAEKCRTSIEKIQIDVRHQIIGVSASFGIDVSSAGVSIEQTIRNADDALYIAKQNGRNQVKVYAQ